MVEVPETMRRIAVILGAGASADAWNETGPPRNQAWQPPLARELFGQREAFWPILERYPGAHVISADLGELVRTGAVNIESKLREYAEHSDPRIRNHFKQVPPYLRDLMNQVVTSFTGRSALPGTHLRLVANLLATQARFAFIDLNYDDYLEMSLGRFDEKLLIRDMADYTADGRQAIVAKVHGSVHWGMPLPYPGNLFSLLPGFDPTGPRIETIFNPSRTDTREWTHSERRVPLYPVLTAPLAGKGHVDLVCPISHLEALQEFLGQCEEYLIIGTSGQDEDLHGFLRQHVKKVTKVHCVSVSVDEAERVRERLTNACPPLAHDRWKLVGRGFRTYLDSEEFRAFLRE
jgi:hypothetical protein